MKKYTIELTEEQLRLISDCLEDVSRFASGQVEMRHTTQEMLRGLPFREQIDRKTKSEEYLKEVKKTLLPELGENESLSYNGTNFIGNIYQIYRTILYKLATDNNWNNVYSSPPLPSGNMGEVKITKIEE